MKERILIIDDDREYADSLAFSLKKDFDVAVVLNRREAREELLFKVDAVLLDINFAGEINSGDTSGFGILEEIRKQSLLLPVVMLSGYEDPGIVIEAFRKGASDYVIKGRLDIRELKDILLHHLDKTRRMRASVEGAGDVHFVGDSAATMALKEEISRIASFDTMVLITGETGVGKEVAARYLHHMSPRAGAPFVAVNIASLSPTVVEAELFGYKKGAFTGATVDRKGYFQVADGGTLFLDEIGDLSAEVQIKLLRFLENRTVYPLGSTQAIQVDTRMVCATNKDLRGEVQSGNFREDLFFRINVYALEVPPLRMRGDDLAGLVEYFIQKFSAHNGESRKGVEAKVMELLRQYPWPGNIRELRNIIETAMIRAGMDRSTWIQVNHLPVEVRKNGPANLRISPRASEPVTVDEQMTRLFVEYAEWALNKTMGNKKEAACLLGLKDDEALRYRLKTIFLKNPSLVRGKTWIEKLYGYFEKKSKR